MSDLIDFLPPGTTQYCRAEDNTWAVCIFGAGNVNRLWTVATGMDKSVALWMQEKLREGRREIGKEIP
jgi:hypothetical protein